MGNSLDASVQASLNLVKSLAQRFKYFIDGDGVMQTDSGPVESLGRLAKRLSSTGYFHPITEFGTLNQAILAIQAGTLVQDDMAYVKADNDLNKRGLYQVQADGTPLKQSYEHITALSSENGRELMVSDVVVSHVTGPVSVFKLVLPLATEGTVWIDVKARTFLPATSNGGVQDMVIMLRANQDGSFDSEVQAYPAKTAAAPTAELLPTIEVVLTEQNVGEIDENRLVNIRLVPGADIVALTTLSVKDTSSLIYKA